MSERTIEVNRSESVTVLSYTSGRLRLSVTDSGGSAFAYFHTRQAVEELIAALQETLNPKEPTNDHE